MLKTTPLSLEGIDLEWSRLDHRRGKDQKILHSGGYVAYDSGVLKQSGEAQKNTFEVVSAHDVRNVWDGKGSNRINPEDGIYSIV